MSTEKGRKVMERAFLNAARTEPVTYEHPGTFRAGGVYVEIEEGHVSDFLVKLSRAVGPTVHETLAREVWVSCMREQRGNYDPVPLSRPKGPK
jgi:hypothetical protein